MSVYSGHNRLPRKDNVNARLETITDEDVVDISDMHGASTITTCQTIVGALLYVEAFLRSAWNYLFELDSYRPILALTLWIANKLSYQEDPTSYSTVPINSEYIGRVYNHLFQKNTMLYEFLGLEWFLFKWLLVLATVLTIALFSEYVVRRLMCAKMFKCWGFKRDKGAGFVFFLSLIVSLYVSVVAFDAILSRRYEYENENGSFLNDTVVIVERAFNDTDGFFELTPWCRVDYDAYVEMASEYDAKERQILESKSNYDHLPEFYCHFGKNTKALHNRSETLFSDDAFSALSKKHAALYHDDDDTADDVFVKNACFKRLISTISSRSNTHRDLNKTIMDEYNDHRFDFGGYCEYVWRVVVLKSSDAYDALRVNVNHTRVAFALKARRLRSSPYVPNVTEGLLNRLSGLCTDACDMLTFFIVLDEYLQKRERREKRRRAISRNASNGLGGGGCADRCPHCSWTYSRVFLFWFLLIVECGYLVFYATASFDYAIYNHRCSQLNANDFDNKNIAFNSFYVNTIDSANTNVAFFRNASASNANDNNATGSSNANEPTFRWLTYDATFHRYTMYSSYDDDDDDATVVDTDKKNDSDVKKLECSSLWNDRMMIGMTKKHRILLAVMILMIDLILVLFSTDFPAFDGHDKVYNLKRKTEALMSQSFDESYKKDERYVFFTTATDRYLSDRSLFSTIYHIFVRKMICYKCVDDKTLTHFKSRDESSFKEYIADKRQKYMIPGFVTVDLESTDSCVKCCTNDDVAPQDDFDDIVQIITDDDDDAMVNFDESSEEYSNAVVYKYDEKSGVFASRCDAIWLRIKKWSTNAACGCCCFCCYESVKNRRKSCYSKTCRKKSRFPYVELKIHPYYEKKERAKRTLEKRRKRDRKNKPIITARWMMFAALFLATFFNITSLLQQCAFEPASFAQIETTDGSIHQLKPKNTAETHSPNPQLNLCTVCPKTITVDNDPYDKRTAYDVVLSTYWRPIYETVEWTTVETVETLGDFKRVVIAAPNKAEEYRKKKCSDAFDDTLWDERGAYCSNWPERDALYDTIDSGYFVFGEKLVAFDDAQQRTGRYCKFEKKIRYQCESRGSYERERVDLYRKKPFPYATYYDRSTNGRLNATFVSDMGSNRSYVVDKTMFKKDCNFYSDSKTPAYWDTVSNYNETTNVCELNYTKSDPWFFYDERANDDENRDKFEKSSYCISMSVLEWVEYNCHDDDRKEYLEHHEAQQQRGSSDDDVEHDYDVYELRSFDESVIMEYHEKCWKSALSSAEMPSYLSNGVDKQQRRSRPQKKWGFEYDGKGYNYGRKIFWLDRVSNDTDKKNRLKFDKSSTMLISETTVGCKITTCPTKTRNDQTNNESSEYLDIVVMTVWLPACVIAYMIWSFTANVYAVKCLRYYKNHMIDDMAFYDNEDTDEKLKKRNINRIKCLLSCCLICHCK